MPSKIICPGRNPRLPLLDPALGRTDSISKIHYLSVLLIKILHNSHSINLNLFFLLDDSSIIYTSNLFLLSASPVF